MMNPSDIVVFNKEKLRDNFAIPKTNIMTEICDVIVPAGTKIQISYAAPAFGRSGGGLQYKILDDYEVEWFTNMREFS